MRYVSHCGYDIHKDGRIYSRKRNKWLSPKPNNRGYMTTSSIDGETLVHRIVAKYWCEGYSKELTVNHKDMDKTNNHYLNLEWMPQGDNARHSYSKGRKVVRNGGNPKKKYIDSILQDVLDLKGKMYYKEVAEKFNISGGTVHHIWNGRRK